MSLKNRYRVDYGALGKPEATPQGGMRVPAYLTRTGVFIYHGDNGEEIREYRGPEEVFRADSMGMLRGAPVTSDHPPAPVTPKTFGKYAVGHVSEDIAQDGDKIGATVYLQDEKAIKAVASGRRELSCGYHCDVDETPGVTPAGEPYDRRQVNIQYNHVALVAIGRAGHDVRLRLDSAGNSTEREPMEKIEVIDGVEYAFGSDAHRAAKERRDSVSKDQQKSAEAFSSKLATAESRADTAEAKLVKLTEQVKSLLSPERLDKAVAVRTEIVTKARAILGGEFKTDGLSNRAIKTAVVEKSYPNLRLDGKHRDYLNGLFRGISVPENKPAEKRNDVVRAAIPASLQAPPVTGVKTLAQARQDSLDEQAFRSSSPLALSRNGGSAYKRQQQSSNMESAK